MIALDDPANLGPTLGHYRVMLGLSLRKVARGVANRTGRHEDHVRAQICAWETGRTVPGMVAVKPYLAELRLGVALVPLDDDGPKTAPESTESAEQAASGVDGEGLGDSRAVGTLSGGEASCGRTVNECRMCEGTCEPVSGGEA